MAYHYVYIMASKRNGTIYTGKTNDLIRRVMQHKEKTDPKCFIATYNIILLVHFEQFEGHWSAAQREKTIKNHKRQWKIDLIEQHNPTWMDLYNDICK